MKHLYSKSLPDFIITVWYPSEARSWEAARLRAALRLDGGGSKKTHRREIMVRNMKGGDPAIWSDGKKFTGGQ